MDIAATVAQTSRTEPARAPKRTPGNAGSTARRSAAKPGRAGPRGARRNSGGGTSEVQALAKLSWPEGPVTLMATDFADLECDKPARTLQSLIELCHHIEHDEILILNLEYLAWDRSRDLPSGHVDTRRVRMLSKVIEQTCLDMRLPAPEIAVEERAEGMDLRITLPGIH